MPGNLKEEGVNDGGEGGEVTIFKRKKSFILYIEIFRSKHTYIVTLGSKNTLYRDLP